MAIQFGEYPIHISLNEDDNLYHVAAQDVPSATDCGINDTFPIERYAIMKARGEAHGYQFVNDDTANTAKPQQFKKAGN